jgi:hypothetical protein
MKLDHIIAVVRGLNEAGVSYLIVGGLAVNAHGHVRYTNDLDLVIGLEPTNIRLGLDALARLGYQPRIPVTSEQFADADIRNRWKAEKGMVVLNLWNDRCRETPVDVFVSEPFNFAAELMRAKLFPLAEGLAAPIVALPALFQMKKAAGRPHDLDDIAELTRIEELRREK